MPERSDVTPNRRGTRSREIVLDAAERLMAERGYEAATIAAIVEASGIPISSVYHYYGSKNGVLLAVMERGAERIFAAVPEYTEPTGPAIEHLATLLSEIRDALGANPAFLRLLVTLAVQPPVDDQHDVHAVINRVRAEGRRRLGEQIALAFGRDAASAEITQAARFALAAIDGAYVAQAADPAHTMDATLERLPQALAAMLGP